MTTTLTALLIASAAAMAWTVSWMLRGARAKASEATTATRLEASLQGQKEMSQQLAALQTKHSALVDENRVLCSAKAAADATVATIPGLERRIAEGEQRLEALGTQLRELGSQKATLESEASRIPALQQDLARLQTAHDTLASELANLKELQGRTEGALAADRGSLQVARSELKEVREQLDGAKATITQLTADNTDLSARLETERSQVQEKIALLNDVRQSFSETFKALSSDALTSNNTAFMALAEATLAKFQEGAKGDLDARRNAVDQLVKPLTESIGRVGTKLGEIERERVSSYASLNEQLRSLVETHIPGMRNETANLVKALRQPAVRGRWGELQLRRVIEMANMVEYCDFIEQDSRTNDDGKLLRPDVVVKVPGGGNIVVDSKAPIAAYIDAAEASDQAIQRARMAQHTQQVRAHITALGRKAYWDQFNPSPDFVVMFIPNEGFLSAALQDDPSLLEYGVNERVLLATPMTLIALLRTVAYGWREQKLAANAEEILRLGKELHERLCTVGERWAELGDRLGNTVDAYNRSTASLEGRVMVSARRFRDLQVGIDDREIPVLDPVEELPRRLQAPELVPETAEIIVRPPPMSHQPGSAAA